MNCPYYDISLCIFKRNFLCVFLKEILVPPHPLPTTCAWGPGASARPRRSPSPPPRSRCCVYKSTNKILIQIRGDVQKKWYFYLPECPAKGQTSPPTGRYGVFSQQYSLNNFSIYVFKVRQDMVLFLQNLAEWLSRKK